MLNLMLF